MTLNNKITNRGARNNELSQIMNFKIQKKQYIERMLKKTIQKVFVVRMRVFLFHDSLLEPKRLSLKVDFEE